MKSIMKYEASDGVVFDSEVECRAYERENCHSLLVGLTASEINAALCGENDDLAAAIEQVGAKLARDRRARGDLKRKRSASAADPAPETPVVTESGDRDYV